MALAVHPPIDHFLRSFSGERVWGEVLVRGMGDRFELRHVADADTSADALRQVPLHGLRELALFTASGAFRPLRTAPTLARSWRCAVTGAAELAEALHHLYPGTLPDAWALSAGMARPAEYRAVCARQLGRKAKLLPLLRERALQAVVAACCGPAFCVKRRLWTDPALPADDASVKSAIPCLEPCPFFLAFAESMAENEAEPSIHVSLAPEDLRTIAAALQHTLDMPPRVRDGDFSHPLHPRRVIRLMHRHAGLLFDASTDNEHAPN